MQTHTEYVANLKFNQLSTDGYDLQKFVADNEAEFQRRLAQLELVDCTLNGRILVEYAQENNVYCRVEEFFKAFDDPRYNGRLVRIPPPPVAPKPRHTLSSLGYTRKKIVGLSPQEIRGLLHNEAIGDVTEVQAQIDAILAQPATSEPSESGKNDVANKLYQTLGTQPFSRPNHATHPNDQSSEADRKLHNLKLAQARWDAENRRISNIVIPGPGGRCNYAATEAAQKREREQLGPRPE